jgi:choline dehydrogenase-like flavoprotein
MLIDARSVPEGELIDTDVVIAGAGLAGITLARELIGLDISVCLLESGGLQPDKATQSLYYGQNIGHPYYPLDTARARFFGGSSHYWHCPMGRQRLGVRLRALDPIDFEKRDWVPGSGWPFPKSHLDPYYERANRVFQIDNGSNAVGTWENPVTAPRLPLDPDRVATTVFHFGQRKFFFEDYRREIERAANMRIYLYANALEVETDENACRVTALRVKTLAGNQCRVRAGIFVLALGGIETPRLLLLSRRVQTEGLGNRHDLVGRCFMEHPHLWSGFFVPKSPEILNKCRLYLTRSVNGYAVMGKLTVSEKVLRKEQILNYCVSLHPDLVPAKDLAEHSRGAVATKELLSSLRWKERPSSFSRILSDIIKDPIGASEVISRRLKSKLGRSDYRFAFRLNHMSEQTPDPQSRVTLADELDVFGQNRICLDWRLSELDIRTIVRAQEVIDAEMRRTGLGHVQVDLKEGKAPGQLHGGWHHMGTTRMHEDASKGVVDPDCRVHGVSNLFIAGASVFPTGGYANPVLTTVALVLRLADHIRVLMRR